MKELPKLNQQLKKTIMKQLKKISLQKEELVSLNSLEMDLIRGGVGGYYEGSR